MLLGIEIALTLLGIYWLITGKARIDKTRELTGTHGRILGFILLLTLPLVLVLGFGMGVLIGLGVLPGSLSSLGFLADIAGILIVVLATVGYYSANKPRPTE